MFPYLAMLEKTLSPADPFLRSHRVGDALVGLVRDDQADIGDVRPALFQDFLDGFTETPGGVLEDHLAVHEGENVFPGRSFPD